MKPDSKTLLRAIRLVRFMAWLHQNPARSPRDLQRFCEVSAQGLAEDLAVLAAAGRRWVYNRRRKRYVEVEAASETPAVKVPARTLRVLRLFNMLLLGGPYTQEALLEHFGVAISTLRADLTVLDRAGYGWIRCRYKGTYWYCGTRPDPRD